MNDGEKSYRGMGRRRDEAWIEVGESRNMYKPASSGGVPPSGAGVCSAGAGAGASVVEWIAVVSCTTRKF